MPEMPDGGWLLDDEISVTGPYGRDDIDFEKPLDLKRAPKKRDGEWQKNAPKPVR